MQNFSDIRNRWFVTKVKELELDGTPQAEIARKIGVLPQYLSPIMKGSRNASENIIQKLCSAFDINQNDLVNQMKVYEIKNSVKKVSKPLESNNICDNRGVKDSNSSYIPLIPIDAMAGFGKDEFSVLERECDKYVVPMLREAEFLIPVKGDSMSPKYQSGDVVGCKRVPLDTFFQWNKAYVLDTEQGALIKRVKKGSDDDHLLLVSDNQNYDPFEIHIDQIIALAVVVGCIRLE